MQQPALLLPDDVVQQTFSTTGFRRGYSADQVDQWLDVVVATMREHLAGSLDAPGVRAEDVASVRFDQTRFQQGYDMVEVDDFLDRVEATLAALERGDRPS
mgnify:FL=1